MIGGQVAYKSPWGLPPIFATPGGAVTTSLPTIAKYIGVAGVSAIAGATLLGKSMQQQQQAGQTGQAISKPIYHIAVEPGGTATFSDAGGSPAVTQDIAQDQAQTSLDMTSLLIVGIIAIGGLMLFKKK